MEQLPELEPPEAEESETFRFVNGWLRPAFCNQENRFPESEKISPPVLQLNEASFGYTPEKLILKGINIDVGLDSRIAIVGANGAGKSTLYISSWLCPWQLLILLTRIKLLTGELKPMLGHVSSNGRLRMCVDFVLPLHNELLVNPRPVDILLSTMWIT